MKQRLIATLFALPLLSFVPVTYAASVENSNTGAESVNVTRLEISNSSTVDNVNSTGAENKVEVKLTTGGNEASGNTGGDSEGAFSHNSVGQESSGLDSSRAGEINTGDATLKVEINNDFNHNVTNVGTEEEQPVEPSGETGGAGAAGEIAAAPTSTTTGGLGGGGATTLPEAGSNTPLIALFATLGTLSLVGLARLRKAFVRV